MKQVNRIKRARTERIWWFKRCESTNKIIWPGTKAIHCAYMNYGGAIVGAPPIEMDFWLTPKAFAIECLKGNVD